MNYARIVLVILLVGSLLVACGEPKTDAQKLDGFRSLVQNEKYQKAESELKELIVDFPTDSIVLFWGARLYYETRQYDTAVSYTKKLVSLYYKHMDGYHLLYDAAKEIGDKEKESYRLYLLGWICIKYGTLSRANILYLLKY